MNTWGPGSFVGVVVAGVEHRAVTGADCAPDTLGVDVLADARALASAYSTDQIANMAARLTDPGPVWAYRDGRLHQVRSGRSVREVMAENPVFAAHVHRMLNDGWGPPGLTLDDADAQVWRWWASFRSLLDMITWGLYVSPAPGGSAGWEAADSTGGGWGYLLDLGADNGPHRPRGGLRVLRWERTGWRLVASWPLHALPEDTQMRALLTVVVPAVPPGRFEAGAYAPSVA